MRSRWTKCAVVLVFGPVSTNCFLVTDTCACTLAPRSGAVYGVVLSATGPVANTTVRVGTPNTADPLGPGTQTSTSGRYRVHFLEDFGGPWALHVEPDSASGLAGAVVAFTPRWGDGVTGDSVEVNVTLVAR